MRRTNKDEEIMTKATESSRTICRACGQNGVWCSVYTSCPLNKGNAHDMKRVCITVKGKLFKHCFVYTGIGDERHCTYCWDIEVTQGSTAQNQQRSACSEGQGKSE